MSISSHKWKTYHGANFISFFVQCLAIKCDLHKLKCLTTNPAFTFITFNRRWSGIYHRIQTLHSLEILGGKNVSQLASETRNKKVFHVFL